MSAVSFESHDLPKERQECFGEASLARGGGDVEYFENYSFLVVSRGSREPGCARSAQPEEGGLKAGQGFWGVSGRGVRGFFFSFFFLFCTCGAFSVQDPGDLGQPVQSSGEVAGFLAAAVFVFWVLRDCVGSQR